MTILRVLAAFATALCCSATAAAQVVDSTIGAGIGTHVADAFGDGSMVPINTSIASVSYDRPAVVYRSGLAYYEVQGTVSGRGWGGQVDQFDPASGPGDSFEAEANYTYSVPFVLRWPATFNGVLVYYQHGRPNLGASLFAESVLHDANDARRFDALESEYVADGALAPSRGYAVFAPNLGGLQRDGSVAALALDGPFTGQPLNLSVDVPISRDLAVLGRRLLAKLTGTTVVRTLGVGHSGGALILQFAAAGVTSQLFQSPSGSFFVFTGGNFVDAYDAASPRVFDGMIPIGGGSPPLNPAIAPLAPPDLVPMMLVGGNADYSGLDNVVFAGRLRDRGVNVNAMVRVYQLQSFPHNFAEIVESTPHINELAAAAGFPPHADSDRLAPMLAALLGNLNAWIGQGTPPPVSRINGVALDTSPVFPGNDAIQFSQEGGLTTRRAPFVADRTIDAFFGDRFEISAAAGFPTTVRRYSDILAAMPHESDLALPYVQCRVGGYGIGIDAELAPFPDVHDIWKNAGQYRNCVDSAMKGLAAAGLYDKQLGSGVVFSDRYMNLVKP
jgi:hypothetical protein